MRNRLFRLIIYASVIQQFLFFAMKENISEINFLYGVPLTHQVSYHTMLFGYWFFPIFFIIYYFSGYFSCYESYEITILIRNETRNRYFIRKILNMLKELIILEGIQILVSIMSDLIIMKFFGIRYNFFHGQGINKILVYILNYYIVSLILILFENLLELFFENININIVINAFIITSVYVYNYNINLRKGILRLVNISMYVRINAVGILEYLCLILIVCCMLGAMFYKWKRKNILCKQVEL